MHNNHLIPRLSPTSACNCNMCEYKVLGALYSRSEGRDGGVSVIQREAVRGVVLEVLLSGKKSDGQTSSQAFH